MSKPIKKHWRMEVAWEDSTILPDGWMDISRALRNRDAVICTSVGFVIADDKRGIVLAGSIHGNQVAGVMFIPAAQIKTRRRLT